MKIGQAAQLTGLTISNIRFYERKGLLEPERNDQSKYRNYSEQDIRRLKQIILYRKMNMPIEKIASMLDDPAVSEELVGDFSEYSEFYKVSGDPVFQFLFCKVKNQKLFGWVWFSLWIALSVFFIVEFGFGDGHMPLVVKAIVIGAVLVFLWYDFIRYCRKKRKYTVKYRKTTAP